MAYCSMHRPEVAARRGSRTLVAGPDPVEAAFASMASASGEPLVLAELRLHRGGRHDADAVDACEAVLATTPGLLEAPWIRRASSGPIRPAVNYETHPLAGGIAGRRSQQGWR